MSEREDNGKGDLGERKQLSVLLPIPSRLNQESVLRSMPESLFVSPLPTPSTTPPETPTRSSTGATRAPSSNGNNFVSFRLPEGTDSSNDKMSSGAPESNCSINGDSTNNSTTGNNTSSSNMDAEEKKEQYFETIESWINDNHPLGTARQEAAAAAESERSSVSRVSRQARRTSPMPRFSFRRPSVSASLRSMTSWGSSFLLNPTDELHEALEGLSSLLTRDDAAAPASSSLSSSHRRQNKNMKASRYQHRSTRSQGAAIVSRINRHSSLIIDVAKIRPSLIESLILVENESDRDRLFSYPIVRLVLLCGYSLVEKPWDQDDDFEDEDGDTDSGIGGATPSSTTPSRNKRPLSQPSWIVDMLRNPKIQIRTKVVRYFEIVSSVSAADFMNSEVNSSLVEDIITAGIITPHKNDLIKTLRDLRELIPLSQTLPPPDMERLAVTSIFDSVLLLHLGRSFGVAVSFLDLCSHVLLLTSFRTLITNLIEMRQGTGDMKLHVAMYWGLYGTGFFLTYFVFREVARSLSMISISWRVFRVSVWEFWNFVDAVSIAVAGAVLLMVVFREDFPDGPVFDDGEFVLAAAANGLLWLKFFGFLKVINLKLATFVFTVTEVVIGVRWIMFILLVVVVAFGDMLHTIISPRDDVCHYSDPSSNEEKNAFCDNRRQSILSVYSLVVGDVDIDTYRISAVTRVLFFFLTFFGILILSTILIAVVDESYEKSMLRSEYLFGRARISFLSEVTALEMILQPRKLMMEVKNDQDNSGWCSRWWKTCWFYCFCWTPTKEGEEGRRERDLAHIVMRLCIFIGICFFGFEVYRFALTTIDHPSVIAVAMFVPIVTMCSILLTFLITGWGRESQRSRLFGLFQENVFFQYLVVCPVRFIMSKLLGTRKQEQHSNRGNTVDDDWRGRLRHVDETVRRTVAASETRTNSLVNSVILSQRHQRGDMDAVLEKQQVTETELLALRGDIAAMELRILQALAKSRDD